MLQASRRRLEAFIALVECEDGKPVVDFHGPPDYETDAIAFNVRLLSHSDDLSMRRMGELVVDPGISEEWRNSYERSAGWLRVRMGDTWAEGPTVVNIGLLTGPQHPLGITLGLPKTAPPPDDAA